MDCWCWGDSKCNVLCSVESWTLRGNFVELISWSGALWLVMEDLVQPCQESQLKQLKSEACDFLCWHFGALCVVPGLFTLELWTFARPTAAYGRPSPALQVHCSASPWFHHRVHVWSSVDKQACTDSEGDWCWLRSASRISQGYCQACHCLEAFKEAFEAI